MIRWKEAKKVIRVTLGKVLEKRGFKNPGVLMYRHRDMFIDIVQCYYVVHHGSFYIDLGCHPRDVKIKNNFKSRDCMFSGRVTMDNNWALRIGLFDSVEEQLEYLVVLLPLIINFIDAWFSNFDDMQTAIWALENNNFLDYSKSILSARKDSEAYNNAMCELVRLNS